MLSVDSSTELVCTNCLTNFEITWEYDSYFAGATIFSLYSQWPLSTYEKYTWEVTNCQFDRVQCTNIDFIHVDRISEFSEGIYLLNSGEFWLLQQEIFPTTAIEYTLFSSGDEMIVGYSLRI